jgi:hypothetical protein
MGTNTKDRAEQFYIAAMREEGELEEAHRMASEIPEAWFAAADDPSVAAPGEPDSALMREMLSPLEPAAQARIIDRAVATYLRPIPQPAAVISMDRARPSRWWLASLPLTAAAAAAMTLLIVRTNAPAGGSLAGEVQLAAAVRGAPAWPVAAGTLAIAPGEHAFVECRGDGRAITVVNVRALPAAPSADEVSPRWLGWEAIESTAGSATLQVHADLPPGRWEVSCQVHEADSGRLFLLEPPAVLVVR